MHQNALNCILNNFSLIINSDLQKDCKEMCHFYFYNNFSKFGRILIILSLLYLEMNCR